jgi:hypothetical protein
MSLEYVRHDDVRWWGAAGDGITDDTQAIQKATNDLGRLPYFPGGRVFRITKTIHVPLPNIRWYRRVWRFVLRIPPIRRIVIKS